jgi:hypothetical protein
LIHKANWQQSNFQHKFVGMKPNRLYFISLSFQISHSRRLPISFLIQHDQKYYRLKSWNFNNLLGVTTKPLSEDTTENCVPSFHLEQFPIWPKRNMGGCVFLYSSLMFAHGYSIISPKVETDIPRTFLFHSVQWLSTEIEWLWDARGSE